jgi:hypothetical protein
MEWFSIAIEDEKNMHLHHISEFAIEVMKEATMEFGNTSQELDMRPLTPPECVDNAGPNQCSGSPASAQEPPIGSLNKQTALNLPLTPPATPKRQHRSTVSRSQLEAHRAVRLTRERSASSPTSDPLIKPKSEIYEAKSLSRTGGTLNRHSSGDISSGQERPHDLTKMAYAEQQKWITVQQKTFTKWLNTKIEVREVQVKDLVKDLSDGVRPFNCIFKALFLILIIPNPGYTHPPTRMPLQRVSRTICRQTETPRSAIRERKSIA